MAREPTGACPADQLLRLLRERWKIRVMHLLGERGPLRFGEPRRLLLRISPQVLTRRLRGLEADAIACRQHDATVPPWVTYCFAVTGDDVHASLKALDAPAGRRLADG